MRIVRWVAWGLVLVLALATVALYASGPVRERLAGAPAVGGPFELVNTKGETVTEEDFEGRPTVYFFGFTHCPDVCPTALFELTARMEKLGEAADRLNAVFVTVDPERDTPEVLGEYLQAFDPRITGLTGTPEQVREAMRQWRVYAAKVPVEDGEYTMDHSASLYLMDEDGEFVGTIAPNEDEEAAMAKLRRLAG